VDLNIRKIALYGGAFLALTAAAATYHYVVVAPGKEKEPTRAEKLARACTVTGYKSGSPQVTTQTSGANTIVRFHEAPQKFLGLRALMDGEVKKVQFLYGLYGPETVVYNTLSYPWPMSVERDGTTVILMPEAHCEGGVK